MKAIIASIMLLSVCSAAASDQFKADLQDTLAAGPLNQKALAAFVERWPYTNGLELAIEANLLSEFIDLHAYDDALSIRELLNMAVNACKADGEQLVGTCGILLKETQPHSYVLACQHAARVIARDAVELDVMWRVMYQSVRTEIRAVSGEFCYYTTID